jgi:RNA polymerase sigma-70 factor (ECF subfamily)
VRETTIRRVHAEGLKKYPRVSLGLDDFRTHCDAVLEVGVKEGWVCHGTELFLCCAGAQGDAEALAVLERDIFPAAAEAIARVDAEPAFVDRVLQVLRIKWLTGSGTKLAEYSASGSLVAWAKVVATRQALSMVGSHHSAVPRRSELTERLVNEYFAGEAQLTRGKYAETFRRALSGALSGLPSRDRNVLRMHLLGRCSLDQIGRAYSVHRATAASWLSSTKDMLFESVRGHMKNQEPHMSDEEFSGMARLVQSQLDLTFADCGADSSRVSSTNH